MEVKTIKNLVMPLDDYAVVSLEATLTEALLALERAEAKIAPDRQPPRAILVVDGSRNVVGQLGYLDFLRALEPKYSMIGDLQTLSKANLSSEFISSMMENFSLFQDYLPAVWLRAYSIKVKNVMRPVTESIDENTSITEAMHKMVIWQSMRVMVTRERKVIGILRLADLFAEVCKCIKEVER